MNLNPFYYVQTDDDIMYYHNNGAESCHRFYVNDELVGEYNKSFGNYRTKKDNFEFVLESKLTKATCSFIFEGKELKAEKVNKKQLRELLTYRNIFNEVNPTKEERDKSRFKLWNLIRPFVLMLIALGIQYFTHDKSIYYKIIPAIPCFLAGIALHSILINHVKWLKDISKLALAIVFVMIILVEFLSNQIYG